MSWAVHTSRDSAGHSSCIHSLAAQLLHDAAVPAEASQTSQQPAQHAACWAPGSCMHMHMPCKACVPGRAATPTQGSGTQNCEDVTCRATFRNKHTPCNTHHHTKQPHTDTCRPTQQDCSSTTHPRYTPVHHGFACICSHKTQACRTTQLCNYDQVHDGTEKEERWTNSDWQRPAEC